MSGQWVASKKAWVSGLLAITLVLLSASLVWAAFYVINTDDGSASEWLGTPPIPVFQTDPEEAAVNDNQDIKNGWVASGDVDDDGAADYMYFLAEMYGSNPLSTVDTAVAAILDCDRDGAALDPDDRLVVYIRDGAGGFFGLPDDALYITSGDYQVYMTAGTSEPHNHSLGQRVAQYVEWSVPLADLPLSDTLPTDYCQGSVAIRFVTADIDLVIGIPPTINVTVLDEIPTFRGYNVPTAVSLQTFQATAVEHWLGWAVLLTAVLGFSSLVVWQGVRRRRAAQQARL